MATDKTPVWGDEGFPLSPGFYTIIDTQVVESVLALTDEARTIERHEFVAHALSLVSTGQAARVKERSAENVLALVQAASPTTTADIEHAMTVDSLVQAINLVGDRQPVGNILALTQTVFSISASAPIEHVLGLTDEAIGVGPHKRTVNHWLAISDHISTPHRRFVEDILAFVQFLPTPLTGNASDTLVLTDEASITNLAHELLLTHVAIGAKLYAIEHDLGITDSIILTSDWVRRIDETLNIGHALTWFRDNPCDRKNYTPFSGDNTVNTTFAEPPSSIPPAVGDATTDRLVMYYPSHAAIARQLTLRAPEFQDRDRSAYTRVTRETRGGTLVVYSDPVWPSVRSLAVTVTGLDATEAEAYLTFMYATLGKEIEVRDWEGRLWAGVITNPENPITQDGPGCKYTIAFELEGKKFETDNPTQEADTSGFVLNLSDSATVVKV